MTKKEQDFRSSQALREELGQVLQNPTLLLALESIKSSPSEFPIQVPGVHYDLVLARECSRTIGVNSAIQKLHDLTKPIEQNDEMQKETSRPQWMDGVSESIPPFAQEAFKKIQEQQ